MPPPTNISAATAIVLTMTAPTVTQRVDDSGTTYTVWYAYTAGPTDTLLGIWGMGDLTTYKPTTSIWLGPPTMPVAYLGLQGQNVPLQVPVTSGTTYYLKVAPNAGNPSPASLTLSLMRGPALAVPAGSIAVNDDTDAFPLMLISSSSGAVLNSVPAFPAGEAADSLPSGVVAIANAVHNRIDVFDATYTSLATLPFGGGASGSFGFIRAHAPSNVFYVLDAIGKTIRTITAAGAFGPTTWTIGTGSLVAVAANHAADHAYYADTAANQINRWNLSTNTSAGLFVAYPAGTDATDILVLADDTVLVNFATISNTTVIQYSAAGAVLHTYAFSDLIVAPASTLSRIATAVEDPAAFWVWTHHYDASDGQFGFSRFRKIQVSDGTVLATVNTFEFETGIYQRPATLAPVRFGHSYSCPFWITRAPLGGGPPDSGGGPGPGPQPPYVSPSFLEDPRIIRRLRRAPHLTQERVRVAYRRIEIDLERGVGLPTGQGSDPLVMLRLSRDGGHTWSEPVTMSAGQIGAYTQRVIARRLGQARDAVFEVTVSDPVAWSLVNAWLDLEPGTS